MIKSLNNLEYCEIWKITGTNILFIFTSNDNTGINKMVGIAMVNVYITQGG